VQYDATLKKKYKITLFFEGCRFILFSEEFFPIFFKKELFTLNWSKIFPFKRKKNQKTEKIPPFLEQFFLFSKANFLWIVLVNDNRGNLPEKENMFGKEDFFHV
jgi:hypothetical protein